METSNEGEGGREIEVSGGDFRFYMEQLLFLLFVPPRLTTPKFNGAGRYFNNVSNSDSNSLS